MPSDPVVPDTDESGAAEPPWSRLDHRIVAATVVMSVGVAVGIGFAGLTSTNLATGWVLLGAGGFVLAVAAAAEIHWRVATYRVTEERLEQRLDLLVHWRRSVARERIRGVDITANPLQRLLGLAVITVDTGQRDDSDQVKLNALGRVQAERLRSRLLRRAEAVPASAANGPGQEDTAGVDAGGRADGNVLARFRWAWMRYAPTSPMAPLAAIAVGGAVFNVVGWLGLRENLFHWGFDVLSGDYAVPALALFVVAALIVGALGSFIVFVVRWWAYELAREPGGTLRVRRGLFTTRSLTIEERRLRGVELVESFGNRLAGAARVDAVMTGRQESEGNDEHQDLNTLLPSAPRAFADEVSAGVLDQELSPAVAARLATHPTAAGRRRLGWAVAATLLPVAVLALLGVLLNGNLLTVAWIAAVVLLPLATLLALDAYRNLGHGVVGGYLVTRSGAGGRSTVALERDGIIGWTVRQTFFQRRAGLVTLTATTAAGRGAYSVPDVGESEGLQFAQRVAPDLFAPLLRQARPADEGALDGDRLPYSASR